MSKIFKSSDVTVDIVNRFFVDASSFTVGGLAKKHSEGRQNDSLAKAEDDPETAAVIARQIIKKAEAQAAAILAEVSCQAESERKEMLEKSHTTGYEAGYAKGVASAETLQAEAREALNEAGLERERILEEIEPQMVALIAKIVRKLLNDTAAVHPKVILNLIRQGLAESSLTGDITIRVSSDDYDTVVENRTEILSPVGGQIRIEIVKDTSLNRFDCVIETPFGSIDCGLDQRYEALKNALYYILDNR